MIARYLLLGAVGTIALTLTGCKSSRHESELESIKVSEADRNDLLSRAQVFQGIDDPAEKTEIEIKNGSLEKFLMSLVKNLGREEITTASYLSKKIFSIILSSSSI